MVHRRSTAVAGSRTLIVTGDDFGLTPGVTRGILHAHRHGILTHASLMASAPFVLDAVDSARQTPSLSIGVHLVLVDGRPCLHPTEVATLVDHSWRFRTSAAAFVLDWVLGWIRSDEVERELRAQIERVLAAGLHPMRLDSHKHVHMWPPIFQLVVRLAREYGIPEVRLAIEHPIVGLVREHWGNRAVRRRAAQNALMAPCAWLNRQSASTAGVEVNGFIGLLDTGLLTLTGLERAFSRLPSGRAELMVHPGFVDGDLALTPTRLRWQREREMELLCSPAVIRALEAAGITLARRRADPPPSVATATASEAGSTPSDGREFQS